MISYAKKLGWLNAVQDHGNKLPRSIRLADFKDDKYATAMPECDERMVNLFYRSGMSLNIGVAGMSGLSQDYPLTWGEIKSFSDMQAESLNEWECDQLRLMSIEYCSWLRKGQSPSCASPWNHPEFDELNAQLATAEAQARRNRGI